MKFLIDMNLSPRWVSILEASRWHAEHWSTVGRGDATDLEIIAYARLNSLTVLTHDLDFTTILALTNWHRPSVVQIRAEDTSPESIGPAVVRALRQSQPEIEVGAVLTVEPGKSRLRILPFREA